MKKKLALCLFFLYSSLFAYEQVELLTLCGGILRPKDPRACFFVEYKSVLPKLPLIRPLVGVMTEDFKSLYVWGGFAIDLYLCKHFVITPSFAPGLYFRGKDTVRLWFPIEFRSCLEIAWVLSNRARVGFEYFHLSNASLSRKNPGVNAAAFFVSFPLP